MAIRVWRSSPVTTPSPKKPSQRKKPHQPLRPSPTLEQIKDARNKKRLATEAKARMAYSCIRAGQSVEEMIAQGFTPQQVVKYVRQHTRKYRRWRRALWMFEFGIQPHELAGHVHASKAKSARWYAGWQAHGTTLPAVIPTGCRGIE